VNIRISATDIDAYRRFRADEDADLATFLEEMRKKFEPTPAMAAGSALHSALEHAKPGEFKSLFAKGHLFIITPDVELDLPDIRECKATREFQVGPITATVVGKVDAVLGNRIDDHKFTSNFDAERFLTSYQWRIYLDIFDAYEFRWNVFEGREAEPDTKRYFINAVHPLRTFRYPGMEADVEKEIGLFVEFARQHLPERIT
jgi:hypothetical protein